MGDHRNLGNGKKILTFLQEQMHTSITLHIISGIHGFAHHLPQMLTVLKIIKINEERYLNASERLFAINVSLKGTPALIFNECLNIIKC